MAEVEVGTSAVSLSVPVEPKRTWAEHSREFVTWGGWVTSWAINVGQPVRLTALRAAVSVDASEAAVIAVVPPRTATVEVTL